MNNKPDGLCLKRVDFSKQYVKRECVPKRWLLLAHHACEQRLAKAHSFLQPVKWC